MPQDNQRGIIQILVLLLILAGLAVTVYLLQQNGIFNLRPKAGPGVNVAFVDAAGNTITSTTSASVKVRLSAPVWAVSTPVSTPVSSSAPIASPAPSGNKSGLVRVSGNFAGNVKEAKIADTCTTTVVTYKGDTFSFQIPRGTTFCLRATNIPGYAVTAQRSPVNPKPGSYEKQVAGIDCNKRNANCDAESKKLDLPSDNDYVFKYVKSVASPSPSLNPQPVTVMATLAEDPNFTLNVKTASFSGQLNIVTTDYTFSNSNAGTKTLYVKFIASNGQEQKANPYPATISLIVSTSSPTPIVSPSPSLSPSSSPVAVTKRVFVTSTTYNGNLGGLSGADAKCQARADIANLGGTWKAWLTDDQINAASRFSHNSGPYKLINGTLIANNWLDLTDGSLQAAINITELNQTMNSWGIWTNTQIDGTLMNYGSTSCSNWSSSTKGVYGGLGSNINVSTPVTNSLWTWNSSDYCSNAYPLYCFEQ